MLPPNCRRALDVGCGEGLLARQFAERCDAVLALDSDWGCLRRAGGKGTPRLTAALHHLTLRPALATFIDLLRPGGVLAIIGLYRPRTLNDYMPAAAALPACRILRAVWRRPGLFRYSLCWRKA